MNYFIEKNEVMLFETKITLLEQVTGKGIQEFTMKRTIQV